MLALFLAACEERKAPPASATTDEKPSTAVTTANAGSVASAVPALPASTPGDASDSAPLGLGAAVVHVPSGLRPNEKVPLVVVLHGLGASSAAIDEYSDFAAFADEKRIAWVAPDGPKDRKGRQFWNAGSTCCNFDAIAVDHVAALRALVTRTTAKHPVDPKRVYVVGYSNGGFMAHRLACELDGLFAGIVSIAGAGRKPGEACQTAAPLRILQVHGDADTIVNFNGGPLFADAHYPESLSAAQTAGDWAKRLGCKAKPKAAGTLDFEAKLPGAETKVSRFEGCRRGAIELWTVGGGNHYVGLKRPAYDVIWKFLSGS